MAMLAICFEAFPWRGPYYFLFFLAAKNLVTDTNLNTFIRKTVFVFVTAFNLLPKCLNQLAATSHSYENRTLHPGASIFAMMLAPGLNLLQMHVDQLRYDFCWL